MLNVCRGLLTAFPGITFLPDLAIAVVYLGAWIYPAMFPVAILQLLAPLIMVEFLVMHSTALMGGFAWAGAHDRAFRVVGFFMGFAYLSMLYIMAASMRTEWLFFPVAWLMISRTLRFLSPLPAMGRRQLTYAVFSWFGSAILYCIALGLAAFLVLPKLGIHGELARHVRIRGGDQIFDDPERMLAWGFLYFLMTGALHFQLNYLAQRDKDKPDEPAVPVDTSEAA